ncbi:MAG: sulfite exporter TauE/SafE family protein [Chitinophagaceae bacterium]|nr:sulfite exporter TauE/SafE family protein [Chitinophagaceae bacterium]
MIATEHLIWFLLLALVAEILGTVGGFGSSLFFVPIAGYFLDFQSVLGITALFHVSSNLSKIALFHKGIDKRTVLYLGIPAVLLVSLGAILSKYIRSDYLEMALSVFLILFSLFLIIFRQFRVKKRAVNLMAGGAISGFVAGLLGTGGAIRGMVLASYSYGKEAFIATSAMIDLFIDASRSVVYTANGYVHWHDLYLIPFLIMVSLLGSYIGKRLLVFISEKQFQLIILFLILGVGLATLVKPLWQMSQAS